MRCNMDSLPNYTNSGFQHSYSSLRSKEITATSYSSLYAKQYRLIPLINRCNASYKLYLNYFQNEGIK